MRIVLPVVVNEGVRAGLLPVIVVIVFGKISVGNSISVYIPFSTGKLLILISSYAIVLCPTTKSRGVILEESNERGIYVVLLERLKLVI